MRRRSFSLKVEQLENRLVPAGNVTASVTAGVLSIDGLSGANGILLTQTGNLFTVTGQQAGGAATNVNGKPNGTFTHAVTGRIIIVLGDGNDVLTVGGTPPPPAGSTPQPRR